MSQSDILEETTADRRQDGKGMQVQMGKRIEIKGPKQLYKKMFFTYTVVIVSVVATLTGYYISSTRSRYVENNKEYLGKMQDEAVEYIEECEDIANYLHGELYKSDMERNDLIHYLQDEAEMYQRYRLDTYLEYRVGTYRGMEAYIEGAFEAFSSVKRVTLLSYSRMDILYFTGSQNVFHRNNGAIVLKRIRDNNLADRGEFSFLKEIRDPETMQSVGAMIVTFDAERIREIQEYYSKADMMVYNGSGTRIFLSEKDRNPQELEKKRESGGLEKELAAFVEDNEVENFRIIGYMDKKEAARIPEVRILMILGVAVFVLAVGEILVGLNLQRLSGRLNHILEGMPQVMEGDLSVRLNTDKNGDELDVISHHFNEMCEKLDLHIKKSYLAEIEQKNAEMAAVSRARLIHIFCTIHWKRSV